MNMVAVKSSNITHVGFDPATKTLGVTFSSGQTYHYANVTQEQHDKMIAAESIGQHFFANFRNNKDHPFTKQEK